MLIKKRCKTEEDNVTEKEEAADSDPVAKTDCV
jgi:hypothetical protein